MALLAGHLIEVGDHDVGSLLDKLPGYSLTESLCGSGHYDRLSFNPSGG